MLVDSFLFILIYPFWVFILVRHVILVYSCIYSYSSHLPNCLGNSKNLHFISLDCCIIGQQTNVVVVSNETNEMYVCTLEEFISSRCSHIAVHGSSEILNGILTGLYTLATIGRER